LKGFADLADEGAARHGDDNVVGQSPAQLLGDLVAYRLGAFGIIGAQIDIHEAPVVLVGYLTAEAVDVVVVAVDADEAGAVDLSVENLGGFEFRRNEDAGLNTEPSS